MKTLRVIEWIGFALIIIGFGVDFYVSEQDDTPMSFFGERNNYIFLIGLVIWASCYLIRRVKQRSDN